LQGADNAPREARRIEAIEVQHRQPTSTRRQEAEETQLIMQITIFSEHQKKSSKKMYRSGLQESEGRINANCGGGIEFSILSDTN
jgi:hypothetical protein